MTRGARLSAAVDGWLLPALIFAAGILIFTLGLDDRELIQLECRTGLFVKEMAETGIGWFPTVYGRPYPDYPATHPALIHWASSLLGGFSILAGVLPTAIAAALTLALTYRIGRISSKSLGAWAVLLLLGTYGFFATARTVALDHLTTALTTACFLASYLWLVSGRKRWFWAIPLLCLAGFACRGPIGFVVPAGVAVVSCLVEKRFRTLLALSSLLAALLGLACVALFQAAEQTAGGQFAHEVWNAQAASRLTGSPGKPWFYYTTRSLGAYALSFPLAVVALIAYAKSWFHSSDKNLRLLRLLAAWLGVIFLGFHIPTAKATRYLLPMVPAASLIAAFLAVETQSTRWAAVVRACLMRALGLLPTLGLAAACVLFGIRASLPDADLPWSLLLTFLLLVAGLRIWVIPRIAELETRQYTAGLLAFAVLAIVQVTVIEPVKQATEGARTFVDRLEGVRLESEPLVFFQIGPDQEDIRYVLNVGRPVQPLFVEKPEDLIRLPADAWVIARRSRFAALPPEVRKTVAVSFAGMLGHQACVVFQSTSSPKRPGDKSSRSAFSVHRSAFSVHGSRVRRQDRQPLNFLTVNGER